MVKYWSMENGRNRCHEAGCPDLCCQTNWLIMDKNTLLKYFSDAVEVGPMELETNYPASNVRFIPWHEGGVLAHTKGGCTKNGANGCRDEKPPFCKKFKFGGEECNEFRSDHGLYQIDHHGLRVQSQKIRFRSLRGMLQRL